MIFLKIPQGLGALKLLALDHRSNTIKDGGRVNLIDQSMSLTCVIRWQITCEFLRKGQVGLIFKFRLSNNSIPLNLICV